MYQRARVERETRSRFWFCAAVSSRSPTSSLAPKQNFPLSGVTSQMFCLNMSSLNVFAPRTTSSWDSADPELTLPRDLTVVLSVMNHVFTPSTVTIFGFGGGAASSQY